MKTSNQNQDIAEIATKLNCKVEIESITKSQILPCKKGESANDMLFVDKKFGIWFYTSRNSLDDLCYLSQNKKFPVYVVCDGSNFVYEIK